MHRDTRRLTVAAEHLRAGYDEITRAQGHPERSLAEAAVRRALDHLDLAVRRLEQEPERQERDEPSEALRQSYDHARAAWQEIHNVLNDWPAAAPQALDSPRCQVLDAIRLLDEATAVALAAGVMER